MGRLLCLLLLAAPLTMLSAKRAEAQRGQLIEDLFRTIADAQLEREQRKRIEAERQARKPPLGTPGGIRPVPTQRPGQIQPIDLGRNQRSQSINVRSREAAEFAQHLVNFNGAIAPLVQEMRSGAAANAAIRGLLPDAYQVAADTRALLQRCDGLSALDPVIDPYSEFDARWRQLSFRLRSLDGLSSQCTSGIRSCDQLISKMSRHLNIQPQFDRHALHDLMLKAATYMQCMIDDLQVAQLPPRDVQQLTHDCRLLRQRLLAEADRVGDTTYGDVVTRFTDFVSRWGEFSQRVYACNDPHLQLRLDRIRECGDETYAVLWMPPPYNAGTLTASAQRLQQSCGEVLDQLTLRSMVSLSPRDQTRVLETSHRLYQTSEAFVQATTRGASRGDLRNRFGKFDEDWAYLRPIFYKLARINRGTLSGIDHECSHIRSALGMTAASGPVVVQEELVQIAAALEGSAENLDADVNRYERYLQPASYRKSVVGASHEFLGHARQLHAALSNRADLRTLQLEAEHMLDGWQQLSKDISHIESHGLSAGRAYNLQRDQQDLVPLVAKIAAALVQR